MLLSPLLATDTLPTPAPDSQAPFARYTWYINRIHRLYIVIPGLVWITTARLRRWPIKLATRHFRACSRAAWSSRHWCCLDAQRRGQGQEKVKRRKIGSQLAIASLALYSAILELLAPLPFALICLWPRPGNTKVLACGNDLRSCVGRGPSCEGYGQSSSCRNHSTIGV